MARGWLRLGLAVALLAAACDGQLGSADGGRDQGGGGDQSSPVDAPDEGAPLPDGGPVDRAPDQATGPDQGPPIDQGPPPADVTGTDVAPDAAGPPRAGPGVRPDETNTGVPPGVTLTPIEGDLEITLAGTVMEDCEVRGFVDIRAAGVTLRRCRVLGGVATQNTPGIRVRGGPDVLLEDVTVAIANPSPLIDAVSGSGFTARRLDISGGVDGLKVGSGSVVEYSYVHDMVSFASDPNQGGGATHNDAIQILEGSNIRLTGNVLRVTMDQNAAIQVTQDFGDVSNLTIEGNFADGGGCTFNFSHNGGGDWTVVTRDNRFGRDSFFGCPMLKSTRTTLDSSGDVYDDDGSAVPVQTHD